MNSQQEKAVFEAWDWKYDYVRRTWVAPSGEEISTDDLMELENFEDDVTLMAIIVACGVRREGQN